MIIVHSSLDLFILLNAEFLFFVTRRLNRFPLSILGIQKKLIPTIVPEKLGYSSDLLSNTSDFFKTIVINNKCVYCNATSRYP